MTALPEPGGDRGAWPQTDAQPTEEPQRQIRHPAGAGTARACALVCRLADPFSARRSSSVYPSGTNFGLGTTEAKQQLKNF
jgi:hypothetical protein